MVWTKTDAGRAEMQTRALVKERPRRNLLLLVDGVRTEAMLLEQVAGITADDFAALEALGLIASADGARARPPATGMERTVPMEAFDPGPPTEAPVTVPARQAPEDYAGFTAALSQMISKQLGLRGFTLVLAVEKASTPQELIEVAERVIAAIRERKGDAAAEQARATLFGG